MRAIRVVLPMMLLSLVSQRSAAGENPYRKITGGVGNCIFSTAALPAQKESSYTDVRTEFKDGEVIRARCYFAKPKREFESHGKLYNSMRDDQRMYTRLAATYNPDHQYEFAAFQSISEAARDWETARFDIDLDANNCSWKSTTDRDSTNGCVDLSKFVRSVARGKRAELPFTADVCVSVYYEFADMKQAVFVEDRKAWVEQPTLVTRELAKGCFSYTVR